jgi:hypothetical protein
MAKPKIPVWLARSEAQVEEDEREQGLRRASFTRAKLTEAERLVSRGKLLEATHKANLETALADGNEERVIFGRANLAEAKAMYGDYTGASVVHPDPERQTHFRNLQKAIDKPDDKDCRCKPDRAKFNDVEIEIPLTKIERMIYSPLHGDVVGLEVCNKCGARNARLVRGVHATAHAHMGRGKSDVEVLKVT